MMSVRIARLLPIVFVAAFQPILSAAYPLPMVPTTVIDRPGNGIGALSIMGSGFGTPGNGSSVKVIYRITTSQKQQTFNSTSGAIRLWNDTRIILTFNRSWFVISASVTTPAGKSAQIPTDVYELNSYPTNSPYPLAMTIDAANRVFIDPEYHLDLEAYTPQSNVVAGLNYPVSPRPGVFDNPLDGVPGQVSFPSQTSNAGEDVIVDPSGNAWFTEGGAPTTPTTLSVANHSRIVSYDPSTQAFGVYNIPGDDNQVMGVAWDRGRQRLWFSEQARAVNCGVFGCTVALPPRLTSFDPTQIPTNNSFTFPTTGLTCNGGSSTTVGSCSNVPARPCVTVNDCVLVDQVCPEDSGSDSTCYHEYALPSTPRSGGAAHMVVDSSGTVWFTAYNGGNYIGRLDPSTGNVSVYPLPKPNQPSCFASGPWQIAVANDGNIVFTEYFDNEVGRFLVANVGNPACLALDSNGQNPCMQTLTIPGAVLQCNVCLCTTNCPSCPGAQSVHSLAVDGVGNVWFTQGGPASDPTTTTSIGYIRADWSGIVLLPSMSLDPIGSTSHGDCGVPLGAFVSFNGAGISVNPNTGDIWFVNYCRGQLDYLHKMS